jgi:hypothetical protein
MSDTLNPYKPMDYSAAFKLPDITAQSLDTAAQAKAAIMSKLSYTSEDIAQINVLEPLTKAQAQELNKQEQQLKKSSDKQKQDYKELGSAMGSALGQAIGDGGKDVIKNAFKGLLVVELNYLEAKLSAAVFENALKRFGSMGVSGLMIAAAEEGLVAAGFEIVKAKISKFAVGTSFAPGGMALVGEQGPELVNLPRGSQVYTNSETNNILNKTGLTVHLHNANGSVSESLYTELRSGNAEKVIALLQDSIKA